MRNTVIISAIALFLLAGAYVQSLSAQGTAFTHQGHLQAGGTLAAGSYDLQFTMFDAVTNGLAVSGTITNGATPVSGGLFTVKLDFGAGVFDGNPRWIEIGVRTNGADAFATLIPRQQIAPTPYAIMANSASNLLGKLPAAQLTGVIPSASLPAGVLTNNQNAVNVNGTFSGDGSGLTNITVSASQISGLFSWQTVSGTSQQGAANTGYFLTNNSQATVTLPTNPAPGSTIRVSSTGAGGWKIAQNIGQSVVNVNGYGIAWAPQTTPAAFGSMASSADGSKIIACGGGLLYTSADYGQTWTAHDTNRGWISVASSPDGTKLIASTYGSYLYTSSDSGLTWTNRESQRQWYGVASSADGTKLVGAVHPGQIYTSSNSGSNWTARATSQSWQGVASSADGTKLIATTYPGQLYTSTDSGTNWTAREISRNWGWPASSADGTKLVVGGFPGQVYTSTDSGVTWVARESSRSWTGTACSSDGSRVVLVSSGGQIYSSTDSGVTLTPRESTRNWNCVASSLDGNRLIAALNTPVVYTSVPSTTLGAAGYLTGPENSAIELQYIGNGQFMPLSFVGNISAF